MNVIKNTDKNAKYILKSLENFSKFSMYSIFLPSGFGSGSAANCSLKRDLPYRNAGF